MLPIIVVGGGPKAAALAAKSKVLRDLGRKIPEILIIEQNKIAGNWSGEYGFTTGSQRLGTPPEKDIGFPYNTDGQSDVTKVMFSDFSWLSYQIFKRSYFAEWVDRGRPHPTHAQWAQYLSWVITRSSANIASGRVCEITLKDNAWVVRTTAGDSFECCGVVFTGPGARRELPINVPKDDMIFFGDDFWPRRTAINRLHVDGYESLPIVVIGGGETAASIVNYLISYAPPKIPILVLTRSGAIFTRGEGYYENRMFTNFESWHGLPPEVRRDVIKRGDRGVFSVDVVQAIANAHNVDHRFMQVEKIEKLDECLFRINESLDCQMIVQALGFDPEWFRDLFPEDVREKLPDDISAAVAHDLSIEGVEPLPKIYVPMLAGYRQGPGFPNLSCLGTLSDRIFDEKYLPRQN